MLHIHDISKKQREKNIERWFRRRQLQTVKQIKKVKPNSTARP